MVDAWGKVPSGIFSGNLMEPGDFHECINLYGEYFSEKLNETVEVKGRYCQSYILPTEKLLGGGSERQARKAASLKELLVGNHHANTIDMGGCFL